MSATVEEMVAALNDVINYVPHRDSTITLMAARDCILTAQSEIAEMRKVTGPKCPKCGHWMLAEHGLIESNDHATDFYACCESFCKCRITIVELLANHPTIAHELGLTPKETANA